MPKSGNQQSRACGEDEAAIEMNKCTETDHFERSNDEYRCVEPASRQWIERETYARVCPCAAASRSFAS